MAKKRPPLQTPLPDALSQSIGIFASSPHTQQRLLDHLLQTLSQTPHADKKNNKVPSLRFSHLEVSTSTSSCAPSPKEPPNNTHHDIDNKQRSPDEPPPGLFSRADLTPSLLEQAGLLTQEEASCCQNSFATHGELWLTKQLSSDLAAPLSDVTPPTSGSGFDPRFALPTLEAQDIAPPPALHRKLSVLVQEAARWSRFEPERGWGYRSSLCASICALEQGRSLRLEGAQLPQEEVAVLIQLFASVLGILRSALACACSRAQFLELVAKALGVDEERGLFGQESLGKQLEEALESGALPYLNSAGELREVKALPFVHLLLPDVLELSPPTPASKNPLHLFLRRDRALGLGLILRGAYPGARAAVLRSHLHTQLFGRLHNLFELRQAIETAPNRDMLLEETLSNLPKHEGLWVSEEQLLAFQL